jgi:hypothetical protein
MRLRRLVPRDEPIGVADNCPRRGWFERVRHDVAWKQIRGCDTNPAAVVMKRLVEILAPRP